MSDPIDKWPGDKCPTCGTPAIPEKLSLVLYFSSEQDLIEAAAALKEVFSGMKAYRTDEFTPLGRKEAT